VLLGTALEEAETSDIKKLLWSMNADVPRLSSRELPSRVVAAMARATVIKAGRTREKPMTTMKFEWTR
jgi:hypothetical protein